MTVEQMTPTGLSRHFIHKIHRGEWKTGQQVPTEAELMQQYRASRYAIRAALKSLEERGWMKAVPGSGRRVTRDARTHALRIAFLTRCLDDVSSGQSMLLQMAINSALNKLGHNLLTFTVNNERATVTEKDSGLQIDKAELDGAIVMAWQYTVDDIEQLSHQLPVVSVFQDASMARVPSFFVDFGYNAAIAVTELLRRGHKRIALIPPGSNKMQLCLEVRRGFELGLHLAGASPDAGVVFRRDQRNSPDSSKPNHMQWLLEQTPQVTAAIFYYLPFCEELYRRSQTSGASLPDGFEVICLTDLSADMQRSRTWPDFACPFGQMGSDAVDSLISLIVGNEPKSFSHPYYGRLRGYRSE
ncbi:MAG: GntR family transcriptional regulator [Planctomycetes bacterium]|nr:GntR family transcriptional regulator [Planctomycetota bacterium]